MLAIISQILCVVAIVLISAVLVITDKKVKENAESKEQDQGGKRS